MLYKIEVGAELDFIKEDKTNDTKVVRTIRVLEIPSDKNKKVKVQFLDNDKVDYFYIETLKQCRRHINKKEKSKSAFAYALEILQEENRPIHIKELCDLIFEKGYILPREGKTFSNTLSTTLNKECCKTFPQIKKVHYGTYAIASWEGIYQKELSNKIKEDMLKVFN